MKEISNWLKIGVVIFLIAMTGCTQKTTKTSQAPNVIIVMTDDQGYGDIAAHGNPVIKTPNLDRLHAESIRFTDFHVNSFCAPTRAALMTGRMSDRTHVLTTINLRNHLNKDETTMAEFFKASGYTTGLFGKWHLGGNYPYRPIDRGFDEWVGHGDGGISTSSDYWSNDRMNDHYYRNGKWEQFKGFCSDVFFDEAKKFITKNKEKPFFVYLPTNVPHGPWNVMKEWRKPYEDPKLGLTEGEIDFFATISHFDQNLGDLRAFLKENQLAENTIILFLTDNGTSGGNRIFNAGMKGKKGYPYEGGHRVPLFVHWPGGVKLGHDVDAFATHTDILPTLIELCNLKTPAKGHFNFDGRSLKPLLYDKHASWPDRTYITHSQNVREVPVKGINSMVATSRWRFIRGKELYDIKADPSQENDVASKYPEVVEMLTKRYDKHWEDMQSGLYPYPRPIIGTEYEKETWLTPDAMIHDHARQKTAMQSYVLEGNKCGGFWPIDVAEAGSYEFEVRRWPKEIDAPLSVAIPAETEWDVLELDKPVLYKAGKAIDVAKVLLRVGDVEKVINVEKKSTKAIFKMPLEKGPNLIRAWLIDSKGNENGAYYVYVRKLRQ